MISSIERTLWSSLKAQRSEGVRTNLDVIFKYVVTGALQRMLVRCNCLLILKKQQTVTVDHCSRGGSKILLRRGSTSKELPFQRPFLRCLTEILQPHLIFYLNTNKPQSCIRKLRVISGGLRTPCTLPLDSPLCRKAMVLVPVCWFFARKLYIVVGQVKKSSLWGWVCFTWA